MEGGLFGRVSEATLFRFLLFLVLVWIAVDLGLLIAGLVPQLPAGTRAVMAPQQGSIGGGGAVPTPDVHLG